MKIWRLFILTFLSVFAFFVFSCSTNVDSMLEDYNSIFIVADSDESVIVDESIPKLGDPDFDETEMLEFEYFVYTDGLISISGPYNASSYEWKIYDCDDLERTPIDVKTHNGSTLSTQSLIIYIPAAELQEGTYKISLTVTDNKGKKYRDSCGLIIYNHFDY
mgnify:FL=1